MRTCFLMGQHDAPDRIEERISVELDKLVRNEGVTEMIVGHRGNFDTMARAAIQRTLRKNTGLCARVLVAYHDSPDTLTLPECFEGYYYPIGLCGVPLRYAIIKANEIVLAESDYLITYCNRDGGNTGKVVGRARRMEKGGKLKIINLACEQ